MVGNKEAEIDKSNSVIYPVRTWNAVLKKDFIG